MSDNITELEKQLLELDLRRREISGRLTALRQNKSSEFRVQSSDDNANKLNSELCNLLNGKLPKRQQNFVSAWVALNKEALEANIENIKNGIPPIKLS